MDKNEYQRLLTNGAVMKASPASGYLDGGSRGAGTGSSNYVIFPGEENALSILERNGKALR